MPSDAVVDNSQRISILAACNNSTTVKLKAAENAAVVPKCNHDYLNNFIYEDIAGLLRQCKSKFATTPGINVNSSNANPSTYRKRLTPAQLTKKKANS